MELIVMSAFYQAQLKAKHMDHNLKAHWDLRSKKIKYHPYISKKEERKQNKDDEITLYFWTDLIKEKKTLFTKISSNRNQEKSHTETLSLY